MKPILIYITVSNKDEATHLSKILLQKKLIACSNILENMTSLYVWQNETSISSECVLLLKTFQKKYKEIETLILKEHSYEIPCLMTISPEHINSRYLNWMKTQIEG